MDEDIEADSKAIEAMLGTSGFGKVSREANIKAQLNQSKRPTESGHAKKQEAQPARLKSADDREREEPSDEDDDDDEDEDDDDDDDDDDDNEFPVSHELVLKTHEKAVQTLTLDNAGVRLVTGSRDCSFKLHDLSSLTPTTLRAFKSIEPTATKTSESADLHAVQHVAFNPISPSVVMVLSSLPQAKFYSRDGEQLFETVKGDMYLRDLHNTKGHVAEVTSGTWSSSNRNLCVTAGADSTLRIWDISRRDQKDVIVYRSKVAGNAGRTRMTAVSWSASSQGGSDIIVAAALDGTLVMYNANGPFIRPAGEVKEAHKFDSWTSSIDVSPDGMMLVTRGGDQMVKLWDLRKFKQPVTTQTYPNLSMYRNASIKYSPTGTHVIMGSEEGNLVILNPYTLRTELSTPVTPGSPLIVAMWHEKLNQIFTGSDNSEVHILFDAEKSTGGAKAIMEKAPKRRHIDDNPNLTTDLSQGVDPGSIVTPGGILDKSNAASWAARHPNVGMTHSGRSKDPRRPHLPFNTPFAAKGPDVDQIKTNIPLATLRSENPRDALLKYAEEAKKNPIFTKAYQLTQPNPVFSEREVDDDPPNSKKQKR